MDSIESLVGSGPTIGELQTKSANNEYTDQQKQFMVMMMQMGESTEQAFSGLINDTNSNTSKQDDDNS